MENPRFQLIIFYDVIHPFESSCHIAVTGKVSDGFAVHQKFYFFNIRKFSERVYCHSGEKFFRRGALIHV